MNAKSLGLCVCSLVLALVFLSGCSPKAGEGETKGHTTEQKKAAGGKSRFGRKQPLGDAAVLIRCGTNEFTMGDASKLIDLRVKMYRISSPNGQKITRNEAIEARVLSSVPYGFPRDCALREFAVANSISVGAEDVKLMQKQAKRSANQEFLSWKAFLKKFTDSERRTLENRVAVEAVGEAVRKWHAANKPAKVTAEELARYRKRQRDYNSRAAATNALVYVAATNVWRKIQGKSLSFEEAVSKFSTEEGKSDNGEWGDFQLDYFKDEPLVRAAIEALQPGQFTPPLESDNGLAIIRLDNRQQQDGGAVYSLSRIFFHLPEFYPELDDATFAAQIREARQNRLFNDFVTELARKLKVVYPNGEKIFEEANRTASQPALM